MGFLGVLFGNLFGFFAGAKKQASFINGDYKRFTKFNFKEITRIAKKYYKQPLFSAPGLFFVASSNSIIALFIGSLYGLEKLGYFSLSLMILAAPLTLISSNFGKVFYQSASVEKRETGVFRRTFKKISLMLIFFSIPIFILLYFFAEPLFTLVFGNGWGIAGYYAALQTPMYASRFVVTSVMSGFILSGKQLTKLVLQVGFLIESILVVLLAKIFNLSIEDFITIISTLFLFNYWLMYFVIYRESKNKVAF